MGIGRRLRRLRVAQGLTQKQLAEPNYTHAYVSTIEAGRRRPSRAALEHFAAKLGVDVEELTTGRPPDLVPRLEMALQEARGAASAGRLDDAEARLAAVAREARSFDLARTEARAIELQGFCAEQRGRLEQAVDLYDQALATLRGESPTTRASATAAKARCVQTMGETSYAIYLLEGLKEILEREGLRDPTALLKLLAPLVVAYFEAGLHEKAAAAATEALRLAPEVEDPASVAAMHVNVARMHLHKGEHGDAEEALRRAEDLYRQLDLKIEMGIAHLARGYVASRGTQLAEARRHLVAAKAIFEATGSRINQANATCELARLTRLEGDADSASSLLNEAVELLSAGEDVRTLAWAYRELGLCEADLDPARAEKNFRQAIELYERTTETLELASTYRCLGDLLGAQGDDSSSCEAYRLGILAIEKRL